MPARNSSVPSARLWWQLFVLFFVVSAFWVAFKRSPGTELALSTLKNATDTIGGNWWHYAATIAAVSALSTAFVEFLKAVLDARRWFHEGRLRAWLPKSALDQLVFLAIGDWKSLDALCSQPIEKMMGEIQPAANIALDAPEQYLELFQFLTSTDLYSAGGRSGGALEEDLAAADRRKHRERAAVTPSVSSVNAPPDPQALDAAKARLRLASLMSRKLDAFQVRTGYYWDRLNQLVAVVVSVIVVFVALSMLGTGTPSLATLAFGLVSGIISPYMKDLATNLSQFATKS